MLDQPVRIFAHTEEIRLLLGRLHLSAAIRTLAVHQLGLCPERLARRAVQSFIGSLVDIALIIQALEDLLHLPLVIRIRGADELIIRNIQQIAQSPDRPCHLVYKLLGCNTCLSCLQFNLLSVLVRTCLEKDIVPFLSLKPTDAVRQHDLIIVADMRLAGCIGDSRREIILSLALHFFLPPSITL